MKQYKYGGNWQYQETTHKGILEPTVPLDLDIGDKHVHYGWFRAISTKDLCLWDRVRLYE